MSHSHKVVLCFALALVLGAVSTFVLMHIPWWQQQLPRGVSATTAGVGLFALKFLFLFDFLVIMIEGVSAKATD